MLSLRKTLRHKLTAMIVIPLAIVALAMAIWQTSSGSAGRNRVAQAFYSDDDGVTWFADSGDKIMPFDHNGKPAVGAGVYVGSDGKPFVARLVRYSPAARNALGAARARGESPSTVSVQPMMEARKPRSASAAWVPDTDPGFEAMMAAPTDATGTPLRALSP